MDILAAIDVEIAALQQARALIAGAAATNTKRGSGRPRKLPTRFETPAPKKKRKMSPEGRARLVAAVKARWAKAKKAANSK